ncbi:hypothetical protein ACFC4C_19790 [Streptomyces sp. NPDC056039]|uniref:hypothetical protein n=1 Tax=Streptomyces sp. NPDC056039 TaxID=3345687 RepID=UPI0035D6B739
MGDPSDSMEIDEPEESGRSGAADSAVEDGSTVLVEVLPGVADELLRRRHASIEAGRTGESTGTRSTEPTASEATTCDAE